MRGTDELFMMCISIYGRLMVLDEGEIVESISILKHFQVKEIFNVINNSTCVLLYIPASQLKSSSRILKVQIHPY